jgi:HlyD family secretion protein
MDMLLTRRSLSTRRARVIALVIGILVLSALVFAAWKRSDHRSIGNTSGPDGAKQAASPAPESVVLASPGRIEGSTDVINVGAGIDGVLAAVLVHEGQRIAAGQILALIDCKDLESEIRAARAAAESARQTRSRLLRGSREEERRTASSESDVAVAELKQARLQYQRLVQLSETGDIAREELEKGRRDLEVAEAAARAATARKDLVNATPLPEEVAKANADVKSAEERIRTATAKLEKCTVKAPIAGTVLKSFLKAGESVSLTYPQPIVSVVDTSSLRVRAEVDERDVARIYAGQRVVVLVDAFPDKSFGGKISSIGSQMGRKKVRTGDPAEKSDRDVLEVLIDLDESDKRLAVGLRVTVRFLL